jgi:hypothetical protein
MCKSTNTRTQHKKWVIGQRLAQAALHPGKRPGTNSTADWECLGDGRVGPESPTTPTGVRIPEQQAGSESPHWPVRFYKMTIINNNRLTQLMSLINTGTNATCDNK